MSLSENAEIRNVGDVLSEDENDGEQTELSIQKVKLLPFQVCMIIIVVSTAEEN